LTGQFPFWTLLVQFWPVKFELGGLRFQFWPVSFNFEPFFCNYVRSNLSLGCSDIDFDRSVSILNPACASRAGQIWAWGAQISILTGQFHFETFLCNADRSTLSLGGSDMNFDRSVSILNPSCASRAGQIWAWGAQISLLTGQFHSEPCLCNSDRSNLRLGAQISILTGPFHFEPFLCKSGRSNLSLGAQISLLTGQFHSEPCLCNSDRSNLRLGVSEINFD
jgi:hypothetical protein